MDRPPILQPYSPFLKILAFIGIACACLLFTSLLGLLAGTLIFGPGLAESLPTLRDLADPGKVAELKYFQMVSQLGMFIFPVICFVWLVTRERLAWLGLKGKVPWVPALVAASILLVGLPFINWLAEVNMQLQLPAWLGGLESWMQRSEESSAEITGAFMGSASTADFVVNMVMIALIPAIGEELVFRGVLQRLFRDWTRSIHVAIVLSAFLFGFIHMQFYSILPRILMGLLFGYMMYWSGSLWLPVLAHFVNNATAVTVAYLAARGTADVDFATFGSSDSFWVIAGSAAATGMLVLFLWMKRLSPRQEPMNQPPEE